MAFCRRLCSTSQILSLSASLKDLRTSSQLGCFQVFIHNYPHSQGGSHRLHVGSVRVLSAIVYYHHECPRSVSSNGFFPTSIFQIVIFWVYHKKELLGISDVVFAMRKESWLRSSDLRIPLPHYLLRDALTLPELSGCSYLVWNSNSFPFCSHFPSVLFHNVFVDVNSLSCLLLAIRKQVSTL